MQYSCFVLGGTGEPKGSCYDSVAAKIIFLKVNDAFKIYVDTFLLTQFYYAGTLAIN